MSLIQEPPVNTPAWLRGPALRLWNGVLSLQRLMLILCSIALVALISLQVFTRYVMGISLLGIEELACYAAVWIYFIGSAHGAWQRGHISASFVDVISPHGRLNDTIKAIAAFLTVIIAAWMTLWAWQYFAFSLNRGSRSPDTRIVLAWVHLVIPVSLSLMTLYWTVEAGQTLRNCLRKEEKQ